MWNSDFVGVLIGVVFVFYAVTEFLLKKFSLIYWNSRSTSVICHICNLPVN